MARKVFISFLGTNNYLLTHYEIEGVKSKPVRFVQEALIDHFCTNWSNDDKILIFYTEKSKMMNWDDNGQVYAKSSEEKIGLGSILSSKPYSKLVDSYIIPDGFSEEEIWKIFDVVNNALQQEDNIYFDVTHAFRSIPMFSTVLFSFTQFMKGTCVKQISYGAFEKLGSAKDVALMPIEDRVAPVINLNGIVQLQQYTEMASEFVSFGRVGKISTTLLQTPFLNDNIKSLANAIQLLDNLIATSRMNDIESGNCIIKIFNYLKAIKKANLPLPTRNVLNRLSEELMLFKPAKSVENVKAAVEWAYKYNMLPQAYTLGQEYIISLCCDKLKTYNTFKDKKDFRTFVSSVVQISDKDLIEGNLKGSLVSKDTEVKEINELLWVKELKCFFAEFSKYRNSINHAKGNTSYSDFIENFKVNYYECLRILEED